MTIITKYILLCLCLVILPFITIGLIRKVKALVQGRIGAPIYQPFFDFIKLLRKGQKVSDTTTWIFPVSRALNVATMLLIACLVPWLSFKPGFAGDDLFLLLYLLALPRFMTILSGLDAGSPFGAFGASREAYLAMLVEPVMFISLVALSLLTQSTSLSLIFDWTHRCTVYELPVWLSAALGLFLASIVDLSRMPIDDPTTHLELTMVHEAMAIENSAGNLALLELSHMLKLVVLYGLTAQCLLHAATYYCPFSPLLFGVLSIGGILALAVVTAIVEVISVKLRWLATPEFIAYALTAALFATGGALVVDTHVSVTFYEIVGIFCAFMAVLMLGSRNASLQVSMISMQIWLIASLTAIFAYQYHHPEFYVIALILALQRSLIVFFLNWIVANIHVKRDSGMILPAPLTMHLSILFFGLSFFVAQHLPSPGPGSIVIATATASISLLFSGILMMLTRRPAFGRIIGFLTLENGVYLFALTQTNGISLLIGMAVLIDIFGAVMIAGVLIFSIKRSFEHIDVSPLKEAKH